MGTDLGNSTEGLIGTVVQIETSLVDVKFDPADLKILHERTKGYSEHEEDYDWRMPPRYWRKIDIEIDEDGNVI